jgi:hypothetical protein
MKAWRRRVNRGYSYRKSPEADIRFCVKQNQTKKEGTWGLLSFLLFLFCFRVLGFIRK